METDELFLELSHMTGSEEIFDYNSAKNILVYSVGCMFVYWDLIEDKKFFIKHHTNFIKILKFTTRGNYLISIDQMTKIIIWEIPSLKIKFETSIPIFPTSIQNISSPVGEYKSKYTRENMSTSIPIGENYKHLNEIFLQFVSNSSNKFIIAINSPNQSQQLFYYFELNDKINLIFEYGVNLDSELLDLQTLPQSNEESFLPKFFTLEEKAVKMWTINEADLQINLTLKVQMKHKLQKNTLSICENLKLISFLNEEGSLVILDFEGNLVVSMSSKFWNSNEDYISSIIVEERILLGSSYGNLYLYDLNGFKIKGSLEYSQFNSLNSNAKNDKDKLKQMNSFTQSTRYSTNFIDKNFSADNSRYKSGINHNSRQAMKGPGVRKIFVNESLDILIRKFSDNSLLISSYSQIFSHNSSKTCISDYGLQSNTKDNFYLSFSHFKRVNDIIWLVNTAYGENDMPSFISCSEDQSLMNWGYHEDNWVNNKFDLLKTIDQNLSNFSASTALNSSGVLTTNYSLQVLELHPINRNILIAGDNKGALHIFNTEDFLNRQFLQQKSLSIKIPNKKYLIGNFPINYLSFSEFGNYLAVGFETGQVILIDFSNECKVCLILEDHFVDFGNRNFNLKQDEYKFLSFGHIFKTKNYFNQNQNLEKFTSSKNSSTSKFYSNYKQENNLRVITMHGLNSFLIQNITIDKTKFLKTNFKEIVMKNKIKKAIMHSSEDYIIVLSRNNQIDIIRIEATGQAGEIIINTLIFDFVIDPSGLYLAILVNADVKNNLKTTSINQQSVELDCSSLSLDEKNYLTETKFNFTQKSKKNYNNLSEFSPRACVNKTYNNKSTIVFYEIGTGKYVTSLTDLFQISSFKFSNDGRFFSIASETGCVSVWHLPDYIRDNIALVLNETQHDNKFWNLLRINYKDTDGNREAYNVTNTYSKELEVCEDNLNKNDTNYFATQNRNSLYRTSPSRLRNYNTFNHKYNDYNNLDDFIESDVKKFSYQEENPSDKIYKKDSTDKQKFSQNSSINFGPKIDYSSMNSAPKISTSHLIRPKLSLSSSTYASPKIETGDSREKINNNTYINSDKGIKVLNQHNKQIDKEWNNLHKYERMGLENDDYRIINKDPSIYSMHTPNVVKKNSQTNKFSFTKINVPVPNLLKAKIEDLSKMNMDTIRDINIQNAIKENVKISENIKIQEDYVEDVGITHQNDLEENQRNRDTSCYVDKIDESTFGNSDMPKSIPDQTYYLNNKIDQFAKLHNLK